MLTTTTETDDDFTRDFAIALRDAGPRSMKFPRSYLFSTSLESRSKRVTRSDCEDMRSRSQECTEKNFATVRKATGQFFFFQVMAILSKEHFLGNCITAHYKFHYHAVRKLEFGFKLIFLIQMPRLL